MDTKEIRNIGIKVMNNFSSFLTEKWYPEKAIISDYRNQWVSFDIVVIEEQSKKISAIFEIKVIENLEDFKEWNDQKDYNQLKKYFNILEEWVKVYLVLYDKNLNKKIFITVKHQLFKGDNFLEVKEFPTYRELTWSKLIEVKEKEKIETNNDYKRFKLFSRGFWILSLIIFTLSLVKYKSVFNKTNVIKSCFISLDYPNLIIFILWIVLILISFIKNIRTQRFNINWDEENKKIEKK